MQVRRKRNAAGQLEAPPVPAPPSADFPPPQRPAPTETADILLRFKELCGKAVWQLEQREKLESRDINAIAALGRVVAILPALEGQQGDGSINNLTNEQIKAELAARGADAKALPAPEDAAFEEVEDDEEA